MRRTIVAIGMVTVCATAAWMAGAAPAGAAVVRVEQRGCDDRCDVEPMTVLVFAAGRGERNRVSVRRLSRGRYEFRDSSARLRAGTACKARGLHRALCSEEYVDDIFVDLGDRNDTVTLRTRAFVTGGDGDDRISGSSLADNLRGGRGQDVISGGGGADRVVGSEGRDLLRGGAGDDSLDGGEPRKTRTPDRLDGGPGRDRVSWAGTALAVRASLSQGRLTGHRDRGVSIEGLTGGRRNDRLVGDNGPNVLAGGDGDDVMIGRGGADVIVPGDLNGDVDDARCGAGKDRVLSPLSTTYVRADCERVVEGDHDEDLFVAVAPRMRLLAGGRIAVSLLCAEDPDSRVACGDDDVELLSAPGGLPGVPRAQSQVRLAPVIKEDLDGGAKSKVVFKLSARGREIVGRGGVIVCVTGYQGYCVRVPRRRG